MPASATITAFYTFTPGTKARATQVNNNFSLYRGHNIPIDPNTVTAIHNTYDLGSTEYRWRYGYLGTLNLLGATSTSALEVSYDPATTSSEYVFKTGGVERARIDVNGFKLPVVGSATTTAAIGQYAQSAVITQVTSNTVVATIAASKITISTRGRPVDIFLTNGNTAGAAYGLNHYTNGESYDVSLLRNGVTITSYRLVSVTTTGQTYLPCSVIRHTDIVGSGSYVYELSAKVSNLNASGFITYGFLNAIER